MVKTLFLDGAETVERLRKMLSAGKEARLAVAYWGAGARKNLWPKKPKETVRILCDLFSGGCNPEEIKSLLAPNVEIRTKTGLHSKVYSTPDCLIPSV